MVSRKENKMNLLRTLWNWLTSPFTEAPTPAIEEQECCEEVCEVEEECCDHEDCEPAPEPIIEVHAKEEPTPVVVEEVIATPAPVGKLLREALLSRGISERVIEKYQIVETFEDWYEGPLNSDAIYESIQSFKAAKGGVIKSKLSKLS
jgi:hypothetical protein